MWELPLTNVWLDGHFWSGHFQTVFAPQVNAFCEVMVGRLLPTFEGLSREADEVAQEEYERLGSRPANEYSAWDMADAAEQALEAGLSHYRILDGVRQALANLAAAALYHLFEQQLVLFHRRQLLHPSEEKITAKLKVSELKKRLLDGGLKLESLESWSRVDELRLVANSVKHAEGTSSEKLRELRPHLFVDPSLQEENLSWLASSTSVYLPLAGQDIYVTADDLERYRSAIVDFWEEFGEAVRRHSERE